MIEKSRKFIRPVMVKRPDYRPKNLGQRVLRAYFLHSYAYYRRRYSDFILQYRDQKTGYVACFSYHMLNKLKGKKLIFKESDMVPVRPVRFEDRTYRIMNNPDAYLKIMYGDYMQLPPEDKRLCHINGTIIFDDRKET